MATNSLLSQILFYNIQTKFGILVFRMAEQPIANREAIKNFQQKIMNRSIADLLCFQGLADYLLQCCSAQAKANTLSFFSFLPILLVSIFISGPSRLSFASAGIALFLHQILDIANKKQAYRLQTFSFGTYYFDHMCDSFSAILIVYILGTLFEISHNWLWFCIFVFALLPVYVHHLTMYYTEYMCFPVISPATEGLLVLEILCLIGVISPAIFSKPLGQSTDLNVASIVMIVAAVWLLVFLILDIRDIVKSSSKFNETFPLKNLFVIFVLGYVMFESAVIEASIINGSSLVFGLFIYSIILCFSLIIGELLLKYASNQKFQQISSNTLAFTSFLALLYAVCALGSLQAQVTRSIGTVGAVILAIGQTVSYLLRSRKIMTFINQAINE